MIVSLGALSKHTVKEAEFSSVRAHVHLSLYSRKDAIGNAGKANPSVMEWKCIDITLLNSLCTAQSTHSAHLHTMCSVELYSFYVCLSVCHCT